MRAALYARVSREEQAEGYSLGAQLDAMRQFCADREWEIVQEYVEPGFTARTDQRPVFLKLMADANQDTYDVIVTHKMDRAFRSLLDQLQRLAYLTERDIGYVSVVEQIDYSTPSGKMFMSMLGALNQYYSDNLAQEVEKGKVGRAKAGYTNASWIPWGYQRIDGQDVIDEDKRPVVEAVFQMYASGAYSYMALAQTLNEIYPRADRRWNRYRSCWRGSRSTNWTPGAGSTAWCA